MDDYYLLINEAGVYVKDGEFFRSQGGLRDDWGKAWERVGAASLYDARNQGIKLPPPSWVVKESDSTERYLPPNDGGTPR